jgi:acyl-CoA thioester hydrolase
MDVHTTNSMIMDAPFSKATATVLPAWIDYNGHMNVGYYHVAFDLAAEPFFEWLGLTPDFRKQHASSTFALQSQLHFQREVKVCDPLRFESRLIDADSKRIHYYQEMFHAEEGYLAATYESLSVHMDMTQRRSAPMPEALYQRMQEVLAAHQKLARPWQVGHVFGAKPPR